MAVEMQRPLGAAVLYFFCLVLQPLSSLAQGIGPDPFPGIRGEDQREMIDSWDAPWSSIGRINVAGFRSTSMCTGTLVAPDVVLTAAHCVFNRITTKPFPANKIHFVAGVRRDKHLAHAVARCVAMPEGYRFARKPMLAETLQDIAFIYLTKPLDVPVVQTVDLSETGGLEGSGPDFTSVGYYRDRPYLPSAHSGCEIVAEQEGVWLTNCNTNYGGSGGPALIEVEGKARVAAVVIGATEDKYSIAVPISSWPSLERENSCNSRAGLNALEDTAENQ